MCSEIKFTYLCVQFVRLQYAKMVQLKKVTQIERNRKETPLMNKQITEAMMNECMCYCNGCGLHMCIHVGKIHMLVVRTQIASFISPSVHHNSRLLINRLLEFQKLAKIHYTPIYISLIHVSTSKSM